MNRRSLLIHLDIDTARAFLGHVAQVLRPGGDLVLGAAETTLNPSSASEHVDAGGAAA